MATGGELLSINCPVCINVFGDPKVLQCGHTICCDCLSQIPVVRSGVVKCPICRQKSALIAIPTNFAIRRLIEEYNSSKIGRCSEHKRFLELFCQTCQILVCSKCVPKLHDMHTIKDPDDVRKTYLKEITNLHKLTSVVQKGLRAEKLSIEEELDEFEANKNKVNSDIQQRRDVLIEKVTADAESLKKIIQSYHHPALENMLQRQGDMQKNVEEKSKELQKLFDQISKDNYACVNRITEIQQELNQLQGEMKTLQTEEKDSTFPFTFHDSHDDPTTGFIIDYRELMTHNKVQNESIPQTRTLTACNQAVQTKFVNVIRNRYSKIFIKDNRQTNKSCIVAINMEKGYKIINPVSMSAPVCSCSFSHYSSQHNYVIVAVGLEVWVFELVQNMFSLTLSDPNKYTFEQYPGSSFISGILDFDENGIIMFLKHPARILSWKPTCLPNEVCLLPGGLKEIITNSPSYMLPCCKDKRKLAVVDGLKNRVVIVEWPIPDNFVYTFVNCPQTLDSFSLRDQQYIPRVVSSMGFYKSNLTIVWISASANDKTCFVVRYNSTFIAKSFSRIQVGSKDAISQIENELYMDNGECHKIVLQELKKRASFGKNLIT